MMEFAEHGLAPYLHMTQEQSQAPLDWLPASMDQMNGFLDNSNSNEAVNGFIPRSENQAIADGTYDTGVGNYGWEDASIFGNEAVAQPQIAQYEVAPDLFDAKATIQSMVTTVEVINPGTYQEGQLDAFASGDLALFDQTVITQSHSRNASWDEAQQTAPIVVHKTVIAESTQDFTTELEELMRYPTESSEVKVEETSIAGEGLAISNISYPAEDFLAQPLFDDELPQLGYAPMTATPSLYGSGVPDTGEWSTPFRNSNNSVDIQSTDGTAVLESILFSNQDQTTLLLPTLPTNKITQSSLPVPQDDFQFGTSSREGSIANFESPRTPQTWNTHRVTPSPHPQIFKMSDASIDHAYSQVMINAFPPLIGCAPPPIGNMMNNFESNAEAQSKKRKRKQFNVEDKRKVNLVRENGACVACHARKVPCTANGTCAGCFKVAANNPELASQICLRTKLKDVYKSVKDIHNTLDIREKRIQPLIDSLHGPSQSVNLTVANHRLGYQFQLRLNVKTCASSPSCRWKRLAKINGIYVTKDVIQAQRFVIVPDSLPSVDEYDDFGRQILATSNGSHSGCLTQRLDEFLIGYCKYNRGNASAGLRRFAHSTLRVASLSRLVAYGFLNIYDGSYELLDRHTGSPITEDSATRRYVSETVHDQLRILAAKGLEPEEKLVFAQIDNLNKLFGKVPNGKIVSGICVLRLMLLYRDRVVRDSIRMSLPRSGEQHNIRRGKAEFMYNRLTIAYSTLCRETTPLIMRWEAQEDDYRTYHDEQIMLTRFRALQPAFEEFCNKKVSNEYDGLFQELILAALKMEKKPVKKRKVDKIKIEGCHDH